MKKYLLFAFIALFFVSSHSAWADAAYVKLTAENGTVSWIEITGIISGSYILLSKDNSDAVIDVNTKGSIDLYEVWSERGGNGIRYRVIIIGTAAFMDCSGLTSVDIPDGVESIEDYAFIGCIGLTSVDIPSSVTSIKDYAFADCSGLTSVVIPSSVSSIGSCAFRGCRGLTSITIPNSVTSIGNRAFFDCIGLTSVVIPSSVINIGERAFANCRGLTSVTIPNSVTSIGAFAFQYCTNMKSITSDITNVFETGENAFLNCENATLYVPGGTKDQYQNMADWNRISNIKIINYIPLSLSCNNRGKVIINEGVQFTNDMGDVSVKDEMDNTFIFQPNDNCALSQVLINGQDVTESIVNNRLTMKVNKNSNMIVLFDNKGYDVNDDGKVDISDVVKLVNVILVQ